LFCFCCWIGDFVAPACGSEFGKSLWLAQMIYTTLDTFYVSHQQMLDSPSRRDGVDENVENLLRIYGCEIIQECGILLKLYIYISLSPILLSRFFDVWCILSHRCLMFLCTEADREFCW
jgi:hypothetical protein